jgi:hypothetical protein
MDFTTLLMLVRVEKYAMLYKQRKQGCPKLLEVAVVKD